MAPPGHGSVGCSSPTKPPAHPCWSAWSLDTSRALPCALQELHVCGMLEKLGKAGPLEKNPALGWGTGLVNRVGVLLTRQ